MPRQRCDVCGDGLAPPEAFPEAQSAQSAETIVPAFICRGCQRRFFWRGNPPHLSAESRERQRHSSPYNSLSTAKPSQAKVGDVLILWTTGEYTTYAVGAVCRDGQSDFRGQHDVEYLRDHAAAVAAAVARAGARGQIHILNIDTEHWSVLPRPQTKTIKR
jgi:hypothetical protein